MEPCTVRAGRMLCVVDVEDIASSLNVFGTLRYMGAVARGFFAGITLKEERDGKSLRRVQLWNRRNDEVSSGGRCRLDRLG